MSGRREVNGAATDASASDSETPTSAACSAPQSFAPSPHMHTQYPCQSDMRDEGRKRVPHILHTALHNAQTLHSAAHQLLHDVHKLGLLVRGHARKHGAADGQPPQLVRQVLGDERKLLARHGQRNAHAARRGLHDGLLRREQRHKLEARRQHLGHVCRVSAWGIGRVCGILGYWGLG